MRNAKTMARSKAISAAISLAGSPPVAGLVARRFRGCASIFLLHSVVDDPREHLQSAVCTSTGLLERFIQAARRTGATFHSLDALLALLDGQPVPRRRFVLTFDDGYRDNLTRALPLAETYEVPILVYITERFVQRSAFYWWGGLRELIKKQDAITLDSLGQHYETRSFAQKCHAYSGIQRAIARGEEAPVLAELQHLFAANAIDCAALMDREFLNEEEVQSLARHPLVTLGAHSVSHRSLSGLEAGEMVEEIAGSRRYLTALIEQPVTHFAYPFGAASNAGEREFAAVRRLGFSSGVTAVPGTVPAEGIDRARLPRCVFSGKHESLSFLRLQHDGVLDFWRALARSGAARA